MREYDVIYAPKSGWLAMLARGWLFADDLAGTSHGRWSVLLWRPIV